MKKKNNIQVFDLTDTVYLSGAKAIVTFQDNALFTDDTRGQKVTATPVNLGKSVDFVPWGQSNDMPLQVLSKIYKNITTASNIDFNTRINIGDGIMVVKKVKKDGEVKFEQLIDSEAPEVFQFMEDNNVTRIIQEAAADMATFYDSYIEFVFSRDNKKPEIVMMRHKEATFSRLSVMNEKTGLIDFHGYSSNWGKGALDDVVVTPFLDRDAPIYDLKIRKGLMMDPVTTKKKKDTTTNYVMSLALPTPGRFYYNKPYYWSIFESRWYDFSSAIPLFKIALIENEMILKYQIKINVNFFTKLFKSENIVGEEKQKARKAQFYAELNDFLSGKNNAGKSFVSFFKYDQLKGFVEDDIIITPVPSALKDGKYLEDSEEASNAICYAMAVHPSLQGASPGKGKTINGTEARELFIIKQAMTKPVRDALLLPLYLVKAINGWDKDIHFVIPNIMLTTLDKNTGAEKSIGNQPI